MLQTYGSPDMEPDFPEGVASGGPEPIESRASGRLACSSGQDHATLPEDLL